MERKGNSQNLLTKGVSDNISLLKSIALFTIFMVLIVALVILSYQQGIGVGAQKVCNREGEDLSMDASGFFCVSHHETQTFYFGNDTLG